MTPHLAQSLKQKWWCEALSNTLLNIFLNKNEKEQKFFCHHQL
jgi:hypothetical protein